MGLKCSRRGELQLHGITVQRVETLNEPGIAQSLLQGFVELLPHIDRQALRSPQSVPAIDVKAGEPRLGKRRQIRQG
jgi:hypothetical protein